MNLKDYINSFDKNVRAQVRLDLAESIGVAETTVRSWANGNRTPGYLKLNKIVEATRGQIKKEELLKEFFNE